MANKKIKVLFHGFGRIGRSIFRKIISDNKFDIIGINEINPDPKNIAYTHNYSSIVTSNPKRYGKLQYKNKSFYIKNKSISYYNISEVKNLNTIKEKYDVLIDTTGRGNNSKDWKTFIKRKM